MRTDTEILARIAEVKERDFFALEQTDLALCLPRELAVDFFKDVVADWQPQPHDRESMIARMLDYMSFAWEKAIDKRGLSAVRSMCHYNAWVWLAGDDLGDLTEYEFYGKDNLVRICELYGWDASQWDDGERANN
jgi:hypothetical protein